MFYNVKKGFTLVETLVGIAVFMVIAVSVYQAFILLMHAQTLSRLKITATALANEQFEIIRNLSYENVGTVGGIPDGDIQPTQIITRNGVTFIVKTTIRNIDDPFDGTISGSPNDLSPSDYKLAQLEITCQTCHDFKPLNVTTYVGPRDLETESTNGSLFIRVFDAAGQPIPGAAVHVENNDISPHIVIDDTTNNAGLLQIVDAPPSVGAYRITVSKNGYSTDKTYTVGAIENPSPTKPHATVILQQLTQISFSIDRTSTMFVTSANQTCTPIPFIDFTLTGSKHIGSNPDILKYQASHTTDGSGTQTINNLEWDAYTVDITDDSYELAGTIPLTPLTLGPNTNQDFKLIVVPKNPQSLMVTVKDASTQLPLSNATVRLEKAGYDTTLTTGSGFLRQTDWSGGGGQINFTNPSTYFDSDGNIDTDNPIGEMRLQKIFGEYETNGYLISSTFDTGSASNFHQILWLPQNQPVNTGPDSVRFQIATNNDNTTWNFVGPDGTASTYYTITHQDIDPAHNGDRYFRYKAFLQTASTTHSSIISDVSLTFTSSCVPPGQVIFNDLNPGNYNITVSKAGYQTFTDTIAISPSWQHTEIILSP